jgi:hypothetical protein
LDRVSEQEKIWKERQKELQQINADVARLRNQKTDLSRYIINREELRTAKRLILWPTSQIAPRIMDGKSSHRFTVSYEISQYQSKERIWCYKLWTEGSDLWSSSEYFDEKYGIKIDLTDEEILQLTHERLPRFKTEYHSWRHTLMFTPDEWLTAEAIDEKAKLKDKEREDSLQKALNELKDAQERVDKLSKTELTVS